MGEVINVSVGQCGGNFGAKFFETISNEHKIDPSGSFEGDDFRLLERVSVFYEEGYGCRYVPRSVFIDSEPWALDAIKRSCYGELHDPDNFVTGSEGGCNTWTRGMFPVWESMKESVMDRIRKEAERCNNLQGFQMCHAIGGGTGSGLGSALMIEISAEYSCPIINTFSLFPSNNDSDIVVEPYNAVATIAKLADYATGCFCFDNEALYNQYTNVTGVQSPSFNNINTTIARFISDSTAPQRFPGHLSSSLRKFAVNATAYPMNQFFITGLVDTSLRLCKDTGSQSLNVNTMLNDLFNINNALVTCGQGPSQYISSSVTFRGDISTSEAEESLSLFRQENSGMFVDWITDINVLYCDLKAREPLSATVSGNNLVFHDVLGNIMKKFTKAMRRKAFLHWYICDSFEEIDLIEFESMCNDLISQHSWNPEGIYDLEFDDDDDDDDDEECEENEDTEYLV